MVAYIEPSVTFLFIFVLYFLCSWSTFFHKYFMYILVKKYKIFYMHVKELESKSLPMPTENFLWYARIGIFNLSRTFWQKTCFYYTTFLPCTLLIYIFFCYRNHVTLRSIQVQRNLQDFIFVIGISMVFPLMI